MKKLKLKLDGIKEMLSRDQMKRVSGGYSTYTCSYSWSGASGCLTDPSDTPCTESSSDQCQSYADAYCKNDDCCTDVNCE